ncbi:MAG TPA: hypothetical protein VGO13_12950 [Solirubrobacterales bacterium]|jgi:hypothetical protein|nr:hypothetical protein [Solirubrobacterales bacterium]
MELSNDQKAILRLLAQRGADGYEDLTALLGIDAAEVHERAQAAAAQLEADGIPAPSIPAPGAAEPAASPEPLKPASPSEAVAEPTPASEPVAEPESSPAKPAPTPAVEPKPPAAAKPATPPPSKAKTSRSKLPLPKSGGARAALAAGVAIVVALVIVILVSGGGSGDDSSTGSTTASGENGSIAAANPKLTQAVLVPVDGGDAKGLATFGRVKNSLALQLEAEGLEPTPKGKSYTVWLYDTAKKRLPLASTTVGANGKIGAQVEVPTEVLAYLANETFDQLYISLTDDVTLKAALAKATKEKKAPIYTGTDVLSGTIAGPIVGAASR